VKRGLALGGDLLIDKSQGQETLAYVGPMARWYFVQLPHSGAYLREALLVGLNDSSYRLRIQSEVGFDLFVNRYVAVGPSFRYTHGFSHVDSSNDYNDFLIAVGLSTFL
jgi:hypothetical protein